MLRNPVILNGLSDVQKFFAKSYIIPTLIESGETFADKEIAELYEINLTTVCKWRKDIKNEWEPNTGLCCSYSLSKIWKIKNNKMWERTRYNPNGDIEKESKRRADSRCFFSKGNYNIYMGY